MVMKEDTQKNKCDGRTIEVTSHGRVHSLKEPRVYDGTATDTLSGLSSNIKHEKSSREAKHAATTALIQKLKSAGLYN